jgi:hypothetical protein
MVFQSTIYSIAFYNYKVTVSVCVGLLFSIGIGIGVSICSGFILGIRKLKLKNPSYKEVENLILDIQSHQMSSSSSSSVKTMYSNPIMRFITGFAGNDTPYQQFHDTELEGEEFKRESREARPRMKPATAEAGSQVCQEIIGKRERRNNSECFGGEGDGTPREGFIQEIFDVSNTTTSSKGTGEQDPRLSAQYTCAVCLDELCLGNTNMTTTGCGHTFHLSCLLKSLTTKNLCPMCRNPLEDVRMKQQPSNLLTPVSAEQIISEEVSYFPNAAHLQSVMTSRHPRRRLKETLRVFGFALLRSVAEYVHDENLPAGWYDDGESDDSDDSDDSDESNNSEESNENGENEENSDDGENSEETNEEANDEEAEEEHVAESGFIIDTRGRRQQHSLRIEGDLREHSNN